MASDSRSNQGGFGIAEFEACFEDHAPLVLGFVLRRVEDRESAEDVVAEVFSVVWRRRGEADTEVTLPWLYSIALKLISNHRRSKRRRLRLRQRLGEQRAPLGRDPASLVEDRDDIRAAFRSLSDSQREVLRLAYWEDLEATDAASVLGCSIGTYRVRLHRARRELAAHLRPENSLDDGNREAETRSVRASKETI